MTNSDIKPLSLVETIDSLTYNKTKLSGVRTSSGYTFFDNSTLDAFRTCPRYYYFKHIRRFNPLGLRPPLIFGSSWHSAMDFFWPAATKGVNKKEIIEGSLSNFMNFWNASGITELEELDLYPRTPTRALEVLISYYDRYGEDFKRFRILDVEKPFIIPLTSDEQKLMYIGKIDKVTEEERIEDICIWDHKTASLLGSMWTNGFAPNSQMDGYHHAGKMLYGRKFSTIVIDGVQIHKTKIDFQRLPICRQTTQIERWLWETLEWIEEIRYNEELLLSYRDSPEHLEFLPAFKCNTKMCANQYGKSCIYRDLCTFQNNPEDHEITECYEEDLWQPFKIEEVTTKDGMTFKVESSEGE
jgi:hypothetical protein